MSNFQLIKICSFVLILFILGCSHTKSTEDLGYYYIDEEEYDKEKEEEQQSVDEVKKEVPSETVDETANDWGYYIETEDTVDRGSEIVDDSSAKEEQPIIKAEEKKPATSAETGKASYYGSVFHGKPTASGELYDRNKLTAAHRTHSFGTVCRVTNLANGKTVTVRINDRGPHVKSRVIDLSYKAMKLLDGIHDGVINVKVEVIK